MSEINIKYTDKEKLKEYFEKTHINAMKQQITGKIITHCKAGVIKGYEINLYGRDLNKLKFLEED